MFRCGNCDMELSDAYIWGGRKGKLSQFCDNACRCQSQRGEMKPGIDKMLICLDEFRALPEYKMLGTFRRYITSLKMFYNSLLARKPREELVRLCDISRRICCELVDEAMIEKNDEIAFRYGEMFKMDYKQYIDAWAVPQ